MVDNLFPKTPHKWRASQMGYDPSSYCDHCGANNYESFGTEFCEDYKQAKLESEQKKTRTHPPTEAAWAKARTLLTEEEWYLLGLHQYPNGREYRPKDYIRV